MHSSPPDNSSEEDGWDSLFETESSSDPGRHRNSLVRVSRHLWNPLPIARPVIEPDLPDLSWPERTAEVLRFTLLSVEHWLSRGGVLREWLRLNIWLAIILTVAAVLLVPPGTAVLEGAAEWTALSGEIVENVTTAVLKLPPIVIGLATILLMARLLQRQWLRRRREQRNRQESFDSFQ